MKRMNPSLLVLSLLAAGSIALSGCGGSGASKSNLSSGASDYVEQHKDAFAIKLPLAHVQREQDVLVLDARRPSLDYGVLQLMVERGLAERGNKPAFRIHYTLTRKGKKAMGAAGSALTVLKIGTLEPAEVSDFTEPTEGGELQISHATVVFKPHYASWVERSDLEHLRNWVAVYALINSNRANPATRPFSEVASRAAFGSAMSALLGQGSYGADQAALYWMNLGAHTYTFGIPFVHKNDGWVAREPAANWKLKAIEGVEAMDAGAIQRVAQSTLEQLNHSISKAKPPSHKELLQLLTASMKKDGIVIQTPLRDKGQHTCVARWTGTPNSYGKTQYECTAKVVDELERMVKAGVVERSVPEAGKVVFSIKQKLAKHLGDDGRLTVGRYALGAIEKQKEEVAGNGYTIFGAKATMKAQPYGWAGAYAGQHPRREVSVRLAHADNGWFLATR